MPKSGLKKMLDKVTQTSGFNNQDPKRNANQLVVSSPALCAHQDVTHFTDIA